MLIFDTENWVTGDRPNGEADEFRTVAFINVDTEEEYFFTLHQRKEILQLLAQHRIVIGHKSIDYDTPVMRRAGMWTPGHRIIDTLEIMKKRGEHIHRAFKYGSIGLENIAKVLKFDVKKQEGFDYSILEKTDWSADELEYIKEYNLQDCRVTLQLFRTICEFFEINKQWMSPNDVRDYYWITSSMPVVTYKIMSYNVGFPEEYNDQPYEKQEFGGGWVALPTHGDWHYNDTFIGDKDYEVHQLAEGHEQYIYCKDFGSLYPFNMMQGNLYSWNCDCCKETEKWAGNDMFPVLGRYCKKKRGKKELVIEMMYKHRLHVTKLMKQAYKAGDKVKGDMYKRQRQAIKININSIYGASANAVFKQIFHYETAADCTMIGRHSIKYVREEFRKAGYPVIYTDTDSVYIKDVFRDEAKMDKLCEDIIKHLQTLLPFPNPLFELTTDEKIKHIWFFKTGNRFKKKHYMYVNADDELTVKGLPMIKNDGSGIGFHIFNKYMAPDIRKGNIKFDYQQVRKWVNEEIEKDLSVVTKRIRCWAPSSYKNKSDLHCQTAMKYGVGTHTLVPNKYLGIGKSIRYCTVEEFRKKRYSSDALILNKMWTELRPFINNEVKKEKAVKTDMKNQSSMLEWTNIGDKNSKV